MKLLHREVLSLAAPSIIANITVPLVGLVDLALAGHYGDATTIGGITIGTLLFDFLYWNMGFLRIGTGGITAQAFGRNDDRGSIDTFSQGMVTAWTTALLCLVIQSLYVELALRVMGCSPEAMDIARKYFAIRIWAIPATLSLMVFKGWFIGMQNTVFAMIVDIWVNVVNMVVSWALTFHSPLGIAGVAVGTVIAQWSGFLLATLLLCIRYRKFVLLMDLRRSIRWNDIRKFFKINGDLFIRAFCLNILYIFFSVFASHYGDTELSVAAVMMKIFMLYSYFLDGFAYAGEAMTGKYIGRGDKAMLKNTVLSTFFWVGIITVLSTVLYVLFPRDIISIVTDDAGVHACCEPYIFWMYLMPVFSCVAFTWDGIFVGATASKHLRNSLLIGAFLFFTTYDISSRLIGCQAIYLAYFVHLVVRTIYMSLTAKKAVFS